jgi:hypothetical protein
MLIWKPKPGKNKIRTLRPHILAPISPAGSAEKTTVGLNLLGLTVVFLLTPDRHEMAASRGALMGWFSKRERAAITNPVGGQLQVVACSPFPDAGGEVIFDPKCDIDGVITADRLAPAAVHYSGYGVPKPKWPRPGVLLPVVVDIADPNRFRIEWDKVLTGQEAAENLAARLRAEQRGEPQADTSDHRAFPCVWREVKYAASSPALINGLSPLQAELALSGDAAAVGLQPAVAKVLAAHEAGPSSAPGGTWDITVWVSDPNGGPGWEAVTRMSFSSSERRERRTANGAELPALVDPENHNRIIIDVGHLSSV